MVAYHDEEWGVQLSAKERWSLPHQDEVAEALQDAASSDESAPEVPIQRACASPGILPAA